MFEGFKALGNIGSMLKNAREMGGKMEEMNAQLKATKVEGAAGGGLVTVEANGTQEILACRIDPKAFEQGDQEFLEDLVVAAMNQALEKSRVLQAESLQSIATGFNIPGIEGMLEQVKQSQMEIDADEFDDEDEDDED